MVKEKEKKFPSPIPIQKQKNYSIQYSRVVSHRSTDWTVSCLTSAIGRERVFS